MPDDPPERSPLLDVLLALGVERNAKIGLGIGVGIATLAYLYRVGYVGVVLGVETSPVLFLLLAVVLATTTGTLIAIVLTLRVAIRRAREMKTQ